MSRRLVIPADATPSDIAWRDLTWQQIADENGCDSIEQAGSAWCIENGIVGLGIATEAPPTPPPTPDAPTIEARLAAAATILAEAEALAPIMTADLADIVARAATALTGEL